MTDQLINTSKILNYAKLVRFEKPVGTFLLLFPTLWALWVAAEGVPPIKILVIFILGTFLIRSAGCVINDLADKDFDGHVERTKNRPLASGVIEPHEAFFLFCGFSLIAFLGVLFLNGLTILLSFVALALAITYPFMKRITNFPQVVLGFAFGFGIPMAFAAVQNAIPVHAWFLYFIGILWPLAYDTMYAMVDMEDDKKVGLKSTALFFKAYSGLFSILIMLCVYFLLIIFGIWMQMQPIFYYWMGVVAISLIYQVFLLISGGRENYFKAFLNNQWFGVSVFIGIFLNYL